MLLATLDPFGRGQHFPPETDFLVVLVGLVLTELDLDHFGDGPAEAELGRVVVFALFGGRVVGKSS